MRNINLGGSWMDEFYKIAKEKGWTLKEAMFKGTLAESIQKLINRVGEYLKSFNPVLDLLVPIEVDGIFGTNSKNALDAIRNVLMDDNFVNSYSKFIPQISDVRSKIHAPEGSASLWEDGLKTLEKILTKEPEMKDKGPNMDLWKTHPEGKRNVEMMSNDAKDPYADWAESMPKLDQPINVDVNKMTEDTINRTLNKIPGQQPGDIVVSPNWKTKYKVKGIPEGVTEGEHLAVMRQLRREGLRGPIKDRSQYMNALKQIREQKETREPSMDLKIPDWAKADDVTASVVNELISLANDLDKLGNEKAAIAVDRQTKLYSEAAGKLYDITGETGDDLINQAHPGGGPTLAPASDEGGKVETIVEEHKKVVDKATKAPTGKVAEVIGKLIATANKLENEGNVKAAQIVDKTIAELLPFGNRSIVPETANSKDLKVSTKTVEYDSIKMASPNVIPQHIYNKTNDIINKLKEVIDRDLFENNTEGQKLKHIYSTALSFFKTALNKPNYVALLKKAIVYIITKTIGINMYEALGSSDQDNHVSLLVYIKLLNGKLELIKPETESKKPTNVIERLKQERIKFKKNRINKYVEILNNFGNFITKNHQIISEKLGKGDRIKGNEIVDKLAKWLDERKYNVTSTPNKSYHVELNDESIKELTDYFNKLKSITKSSSIKNAGNGAPSFSLETTKENTTTPVSKQKKKYIKPENDENVIKLQEALKGAGFDPGTIDGYWGPKTAIAWNNFLSGAPVVVVKHMKPIVNPKGQRHGDRPNSISYASKIINYISSRKKNEGTSFIPLESGINVPLEALLNPRVFVNYMQGKLGSRPFPPSSALQYLKELLDYTYDKEYNIVKKAPEYVQKWRKQIDYLTNQFQKYLLQEKKSPSGQKNELLDPFTEEKHFSYPWQKSNVPGMEKNISGRETNVTEEPYQKRTDFQAGSKNIGIKGLFYPKTLDNLDDIKQAINYLPSGTWFSTVDNFKTFAYSQLSQKGGPRKLPNTYEEAGKIYFNRLRRRVAEILAGLNKVSGNLRRKDPGTLKDLEEFLSMFNRALLSMGQQLGIIE